MQAISVDGREIEFNQMGFIVDFNDWNEEVAKSLAKINNLELTECHWVVINFMREFYSEFQVPPSKRNLIKAVGDQIDERGCTGKTLERLFPVGGCKQACRFAGLPEPYCAAC